MCKEDDIPVADMRFDIQCMINTVYNHIDGVNDTTKLESKFKEFDKKYNPDNHCADVDVKKELGS